MAGRPYYREIVRSTRLPPGNGNPATNNMNARAAGPEGSIGQGHALPVTDGSASREARLDGELMTLPAGWRLFVAFISFFFFHRELEGLQMSMECPCKDFSLTGRQGLVATIILITYCSVDDLSCMPVRARFML